MPAISRCTSTLSSPLALEVGQRDRDRLADQPAAVDGQPVVAAQRQPGVLEVEQLVGGDVDGHLLVVPDPAARASRGSPASAGLRRRLLGGLAAGSAAPRVGSASSGTTVGAEQVVGRRQAHASRQRASTSLASWR